MLAIQGITEAVGESSALTHSISAAVEEQAASTSAMSGTITGVSAATPSGDLADAVRGLAGTLSTDSGRLDRGIVSFDRGAGAEGLPAGLQGASLPRPGFITGPAAVPRGLRAVRTRSALAHGRRRKVGSRQFADRGASVRQAGPTRARP